VSEMAALLAHMDEPELAEPLLASEYDLAEGYELWSRTYDAPLRLFFIEQAPMQVLFATLPAGTVLDAACGTGRHSGHLAQAGHRIIGVDRSPAMLARARAKLPQGDFREGDLTGLPVETASIDAVVCALALVHLPDLAGAMAEFARVLRSGGRAIISDVHPFLVMLGWQAQFRTEGGDAGFIRLNGHLLGLRPGDRRRRPARQVVAGAAAHPARGDDGRNRAAARGQSRGLGRAARGRDLGSGEALSRWPGHAAARGRAIRRARMGYCLAGCCSGKASAGRRRARIKRRTG